MDLLDELIKSSKDLVHLLYLHVFKFSKFLYKEPYLPDRKYGSNLSIEPKVNASCQEDSVLGMRSEHTNDTIDVIRGISCTITRPLTQRMERSYRLNFSRCSNNHIICEAWSADLANLDNIKISQD